MEQHAADDLSAAAKRDGIGWMPSGCVQRAQDLVLCADQTDVEGIARNAFGRARRLRRRLQWGVVFVVAPQRREGNIGEQQIHRAERDGSGDEGEHVGVRLPG
jgi:hypothetical protein